MSEVAPANLTNSWHPDEFPILFERYQILGIIGEGGMGTVYKGYHLNLKRFVAIKTIRLDSTQRPELLARFLREMELVGQMDHPNVVRASDAGEKNGVFHLVMEYLTGSDLGRLLAERGRLTAADACELTRQTAVGLDYIHRTLIHRDIKPSNLMLTSAGQIKILDLGLARFHEAKTGREEQTPHGYVMGTFDYMAPEQAVAGAPVDGRADVYSLGCTLFQLLTGRVPFHAPDHDTPAKKLFAHCHVPLTSVGEFQTIPDYLRPIVERMTAKNPDDRYRSAREVVQALEPFVTGAESAALLAGAEDLIKTAVKPLPPQLAEELERLSTRVQQPLPSAPTVVSSSGPPPTAPRRRWLLAAAGLLTCVLAVLGSFLVPGLWDRTGKGERPVVGPNPEAEEIPLPLSPARLLSLEDLPPTKQFDLLKKGESQPDLFGFSQGDGLATGRWLPGRQQLVISPTGVVLIQMATTAKEKPSFSFRTLVDQRPWSGSIGVFWGYQEDEAVKKRRRPKETFAWFQMLHLTRGRDLQGGVQFAIERAAAELQFDTDGRVMLASQKNVGRHPLPNLANEQAFEIVVDNGRLLNARFGGAEMKNLCSAELDKKFPPDRSRGAIGVATFAANVTVRRPWIIPHADN